MQTIDYFLSYKPYYHSFTEIAVCLMMIIDLNEEDQVEAILSKKNPEETIDKEED